MAIAKGANVIVTRGGVQRPGTVFREVASFVTESINAVENVPVRRYEVRMPQHGQWPSHTDVFSENELRVVPRDRR